MTIYEAFVGERKRFSKLCAALFAALFLAYAVIIVTGTVCARFFPALWDNEWFSMLINNLYTVIAIILFVIFTEKPEARKRISDKSMTPKIFFVFFAVTIAMMVAGAWIGNSISSVIGDYLGNTQENSVEEVINSTSSLPLFVSVVIIAPVAEELLFRKLLIDRISGYGTWFSAIFSAAVFGIFHGNFYQFFYASLIGVVFGYIYYTYGKIRYTIVYHMLINFMGSIIARYVVGISDSGEMIHIIITMLYSAFYMSMCIGGIAFIAVYARRACHDIDPYPFPVSPINMFFSNVGVILLAVYGAGLFAMSIFL